MTGVINDSGLWFFLDTHVQLDPTAEQIAESTLQATYRLKLFGVEPRVALLSHSNFGSHDNASRSEEHTSELQSLMRISYAVFCLKKKTDHKTKKNTYTDNNK